MYWSAYDEADMEKKVGRRSPDGIGGNAAKQGCLSILSLYLHRRSRMLNVWIAVLQGLSRGR
jgi:hypothetical protein